MKSKNTSGISNENSIQIESYTKKGKIHILNLVKKKKSVKY